MSFLLPFSRRPRKCGAVVMMVLPGKVLRAHAVLLYKATMYILARVYYYSVFPHRGLYTGQREKNDNFPVVIIYRKKQIPNTCSSRPNGNFEQTSSPIYYYDDNRNGYNGELWRLEPVSGLFSFGNQFYNTKITETSI